MTTDNVCEPGWMAPLYTSNSFISASRPVSSALEKIWTPSSAYTALIRLYEVPISFLWRMIAREAPSVPPRTVSFSRFKRAFVRKICSFSSLTFFSSARRRTEFAASAPATGAPAGAGPPSLGAAGAAAGAGAGAAEPAAGGTGAPTGAAAATGAGAAGVPTTWPVLPTGVAGACAWAVAVGSTTDAAHAVSRVRKMTVPVPRACPREGPRVFGYRSTVIVLAPSEWRRRKHRGHRSEDALYIRTHSVGQTCSPTQTPCRTELFASRPVAGGVRGASTRRAIGAAARLCGPCPALPAGRRQTSDGAFFWGCSAVRARAISVQAASSILFRPAPVAALIPSRVMPRRLNGAASVLNRRSTSGRSILFSTTIWGRAASSGS